MAVSVIPSYYIDIIPFIMKLEKRFVCQLYITINIKKNAVVLMPVRE